MQIKTILRLLGILLLIFSASMLTPLPLNLVFHESFWYPFVAAFSCTFVTGGLLWFCFRYHQEELKIRDGFLIVVLFWFVLSLFAALPFLFATSLHPPITDAIFESVSGLTTTGLTTISHLDALPHAFLYYRQQLQFLGGMGIIVLAVAILPMLGVGGMQLYRAETPGPMKDSKLTPRITQTAKALWFIYFALTLLCATCYWLFGMNWFDALGESFATVSTGGFSMHTHSFAHYHSHSLELIASVFMLLGGTNFALHFLALQKRSLTHYWLDEEFRCYIIFLITTSLTVTLLLITYHLHHANVHTLIHSVFNVISMTTTTGFDVSSLSIWPNYLSFFILLSAVMGGCAASTSGGIKVLRALLIYKQSKREMIRLLHPNAIIPIKFGQQILPEPVLQSMWGFISVFIALGLILTIIFMALGHDLVTSIYAIGGALANVGAGTSQETFFTFSNPSKWVLIFGMLAGRLEIFSLLIIITPEFWRK